ncbi:MAG TPA: hypothetical protein VF172_07185 [Nitrososphaera sp.]
MTVHLSIEAAMVVNLKAGEAPRGTSAVRCRVNNRPPKKTIIYGGRKREVHSAGFWNFRFSVMNFRVSFSNRPFIAFKHHFR